ncbi:MAG: DegT/DnrJ/EryC1/StrS family aminotransferase [Treponema sp.]|nr:DegT/DnrJ/EryC1/StrS family aminotransferase [Treponema sp.]
MSEDTGIPFARPFMGREEEEAAIRVLRSGWLTTGAETLALEREFAEFLQGPASGGSGGDSSRRAPLHALAVNSATSGLHLALEACGAGPGDAVLVPSYTFTSTAEVVRYLGAEPVFVDVTPGGFHMDPRALENTLDRLSRGLPPYPPRPGLNAAGGRGFGPQGFPRAVIPVHYGGLPCDMTAILAVSRRYGLKVVEDAAHAFPSRLADGSFAGTWGDAGVFSFYATKTMTTGEGGMVVCGDKQTADRVSVMRSHGIDRSVWNRYTDTKASWYYEVVEAGYKYNLPDILGAIGRVQLSRAWDLLKKRAFIAAQYDEAFGGDEAFILPPTGPGDARHLYPLRLNRKKIFLGRDEFIEKLKDRGIGVSVHFIPLHTMPYYKNRYDLRDEDFPESLNSFSDIISLPLWPGMTESQIHRVITMVKAVKEDYTQ